MGLIPHATEQLSPCTTTTEAHKLQRKSSPYSLQLEIPCMQQQRPSTAINKEINKWYLNEEIQFLHEYTRWSNCIIGYKAKKRQRWVNLSSNRFCPDMDCIYTLITILLVKLKSAAAAAAAKSIQSCQTLCDPTDGSPPGFPSLGFSRQEHWSGLPFPSPMYESEKSKWSRSVVSDSSNPMDCSLPGSLVHGIFQAKVLEWGAI